MTHSVDPRDFANVEESQDSDALVGYLRGASLLDEMRAMNDYIHHLLDVRKGNSVLDVGCGTGDAVRELADVVGSKGRVVGVDTATMVAAPMDSHRLADRNPRRYASLFCWTYSGIRRWAAEAKPRSTEDPKRSTQVQTPT